MSEKKVGLETEMFTVSEEGKIINASDSVFSLFSSSRISKYLLEEMGLAVVEMGSPPAENTLSLFSKFLKILREVVEKSEEKNIFFLPFGTHPSNYKPKIRHKDWYAAQEGLYGKKKHRQVVKICGFHFHYTIPKGIVEKKNKLIKRLTRSKSKDLFLNLYNFSIAMEPAVMTLLQSSPFFDGVHYGKDCRTLVYRDMALPEFNLYGLFRNLPLLGGLPHYEFTLEDVRDLASRRKNIYLDILRSNNVSTNKVVGETSLKFVWGPLRVNKIGTLEFRGFDMNYPRYLIPSASVVEEALNIIVEGKLQPLPSDVGISEPFRVEDDVVFLPPYSMVKSAELLSSRFGFGNSFVFNYCSSLINFVLKHMDRNSPNLRSVRFAKTQIIEKKRTLSDEMLMLLKKNGYSSINEHSKIPSSMLNHLSAYYSHNYLKEIDYSLKTFF